MKRHLRALILMMVFVFGIFNLCSFADTEYSLTVIQDGMRITTRKVPGTNITLSSKSDKITGWIVEEGGVTVTNNSFIMPSANVSIRANYQKTNVAVNAPVLIDGLTPVNWNGSAWETTTESNWDYNYNSVAEATHSTVAGNGDGKWANAQTADGSLYVWIPRYSYKITSGEHQSGNSWNSLDAAGTNKIEVKFSNGTTDDTSNSYIKHPAFTFGTDELEGIWVAKYEASQGNTTSETSVPTSSTSVAKSIPGVASWRDITVSKTFDYAYNTYRNADSHLMKNVEWGAVAYLTNAIGRIPYKNNSSDYITGNAGGSQNASEASGTTTNAWNTAGGVKASTTHNVYGIYDMSGGADEYVAAYYTGGSSSSISSLTNAADKYVDRYSTAYSASKKGDAVYETSSSSSGSTSWDGDYSFAPYSDYPVFERGGNYLYNYGAGVFYFHSYNGNANSSRGFRVVLTAVQPTAPTSYTITYNLDGGTVTGNPTTYTIEDAITLVNPTKDGYNFTGWTGTGLSSATTTVIIAKGSTGDRTYTANWEVAGREFIKTTTLVDGATYIVCSDTNALQNNSGSIASSTVSVVNDKITTADKTIMWTYSGGKLINDATGTIYYLKGTSSAVSLATVASQTDIRYDASSSKLKVAEGQSSGNPWGGNYGTTFYYLAYNSGFTVNTSGSTITLYAEEGLILNQPTSTVGVNEISVRLTGNLLPSGGNIKYELYVNNSKKAEKTTNSGNAITIVAEELSPSTKYQYYIKAISEDNPNIVSKTDTLSDRTYLCNGSGYYCSGPVGSSSNPCSTCGGVGSTSHKITTNNDCHSCDRADETEYICNTCSFGAHECGYNGSIAWSGGSTVHEASCSSICSQCNGTVNIGLYLHCRHGKDGSHSYCAHGNTQKHY